MARMFVRNVLLVACVLVSQSAWGQFFGAAPIGTSDLSTHAVVGVQGAVGFEQGRYSFFFPSFGVSFQKSMNEKGEVGVFFNTASLQFGVGLGIHKRFSLGLDLMGELSSQGGNLPLGKKNLASAGYSPPSSFGGNLHGLLTLFQSKALGIAWIPRVYLSGVLDTVPSETLWFYSGLEPIRLAVSHQFANGAFVNVNLGVLFDPQGHVLRGTLLSHQARFDVGAYFPLLQSTPRLLHDLGLVGSIDNAVGLTVAEDAANRFVLAQGSLGLRWTKVDFMGIELTGKMGMNPIDRSIWGGVFFTLRAYLKFSDYVVRDEFPRSNMSSTPTVGPSSDPPPSGSLDQDADGVVDRMDACPMQPGLPKYRGCPVPDADGDGLDDEQDRCPYDPGPKAQLGCTKRETIAIASDRIEVKAGLLYVRPRKNKTQGWLTAAGRTLFKEISDVMSHRLNLAIKITLNVGKRGPLKENIRTIQQEQIMQRLDAALCVPLQNAFGGRVSCNATLEVLARPKKGEKSLPPYEKIQIRVLPPLVK